MKSYFDIFLAILKVPVNLAGITLTIQDMIIGFIIAGLVCLFIGRVFK